MLLDIPTDGRMDRPSYRDARTLLKRTEEVIEKKRRLARILSNPIDSSSN